MMTNYAQIYCTVEDLIGDMEAPGGEVARLYQAIRDTSDYLQKEIGWFIPVLETLKMRGSGNTLLRVPPITSVSSIVNDDDTLSASDYFLRGLETSRPFWANGPYIQIEVDPDSSLISAWCDSEPDSVQIIANHGMYERSAALTATVADTTQQSASQATLKVSDGSQVSPGMVLKLGDEQELVTGYSDPSAAVTTLNGAVAAADEEITVTNSALVNVGEIIRADFEQMKVRDRNTTTHKLAVWRGWNRTNRVAHLTAVAVDVYRTVNVERGVNGTTAATHANGLAISRYFAPDDIQFLTREVATLMLNKAKGGYAGRSGNEQTGVTFYNDAFPKFDIERIKEKYYLP